MTSLGTVSQEVIEIYKGIINAKLKCKTEAIENQIQFNLIWSTLTCIDGIIDSKRL